MAIQSNIKSVTAFAPASCGNVAVGFDILGFAIAKLGDEITLIRRDDREILIENLNSQYPIPTDNENNTASVALMQLIKDLKLKTGFTMQIKKGIPSGSGLGSSAASAVAAVVALNGFLVTPLLKDKLVHYALLGEQLASGQKHPDNVVPSLYGGLVLTRQMEPLDSIQLPIPNCLSVFILPDLSIHTKNARAMLSDQVALKDHVHQSANLAAFISALYQNDLNLLSRSLQDNLIEPQRAKLIPGFHQVKTAALAAGALGMSLSGSGPTLFALAKTRDEAESVRHAMLETFSKTQIKAKSWILPFNVKGAYVKNIET